MALKEYSAALPRPVEWYQHVPAAIYTLRGLPCPVVDRSCVESIFHLGRRQAIRLMSRFGGYQSGKAYLLDRLDLIQKLEAILDQANFSQDRARRQRVASMAIELQQNWKARQKTIQPAPSPIRGFADLPHSIILEERRLEIHFATQEELLTHLLSLVQALAQELN